jgi:hypothetical protein
MFKPGLKMPVAFRLRIILLYVVFGLTFFLLDLSHAQYVRREFFANEQQRRIRYALNDWISHTRTRSFSSMTVGDRYIYISTRDGGILRYHFYDNYWDYPFTTSSGLPDNHVEKVVYDPTTAYLWAFTPDDVAIFNPASREWIRKSENPDWIYQPPDSSDLVNPNNPGKERFFGRAALRNLPNYFANGEYSILSDWILMDGHFQEFPFVGYLIDRYDRIWFLIDGFGIGQGETYTQRADFYGMGLPDISPRTIAYQNDDLWFGGVSVGRRFKNRPGIARWPFENPGWDYYQARWIPHLPSDNVTSILVDGDSIWFGTDYGVSLYDMGKDRWYNFNEGKGLISNDVRDLAILDDYLYAATVFGVSRISLLTGGVEKIKDTRLLNLPFHRLAVQKDTLWGGTFRGIFRYIGSTKKWEFVPSRAAIQDLEVTALATFQNEVWFASSGGMMWLDTETGNWQSFPQVAGEVAGPYKDIKVNDAAVWVATPEGLLKYNRELKYWRLFTTRDGLLDNRCHWLMLDGDYIWIVTEKGVTEFFWNNPHRID